MQTALRLKQELENNVEMTSLLEALKGIAAAKYKMLEKRRESFKVFLNTFEKFFHMIDFSKIDHPLARGRGRLGIIMVTSDEGFMGGLNTRVINVALDIEGSSSAKLIILGAQGARYLWGLGREFKDMPGVSTDKRYEEALKLKDFIIKEAMAGEFARLKLVYPQSISFTLQKPTVITLLPCSELFEKRKDLACDEGKEVITEGTCEAIIEYLLETWITEKLFEVFEDSNLSEFSARVVHLEGSSQALERQSKALKVQYFRSRHEAIDKGIRETFASRVIRRKKYDERSS